MMKNMNCKNVEVKTRIGEERKGNKREINEEENELKESRN